jgi:hypothetical protein
VIGEHLVGPLAGQQLVNLRAIQGVNPFELEYVPNLVVFYLNQNDLANETLDQLSPSSMRVTKN